MTARLPRDHWVVCREYAAGPYTPREAARIMGTLAPGATARRMACPLPHAIVRAAWWNDVHRPQPSDEPADECVICVPGQCPGADCPGWQGDEPFGVPDPDCRECLGTGRGPGGARCGSCPGA